MVGVLPSIQIRSRQQYSPTAASSVPITTAAAMPQEAKMSACSRSSLPSWRDTATPEPLPIIKPRAWIMVITEKTTPTAPEALVPIWETK